MARILFIVNEHPNEAFAISVAKEAAKRLRAGGHNVIMEKIRPEETMLGRVLKRQSKSELSWEDVSHIENNKKIIVDLHIQKHNPDISYTFHCTPHTEGHWKHYRHDDFTIQDSADMGERLNVIEIKARYKNIPRRTLNNIMPKLPKEGWNVPRANYFLETTSQKLTRNAGLTPEKLGRAIAGMVNGRLEFMKFLEHLESHVGRQKKPKRLMRVRQRLRK